MPINVDDLNGRSKEILAKGPVGISENINPLKKPWLSESEQQKIDRCNALVKSGNRYNEFVIAMIQNELVEALKRARCAAETYKIIKHYQRRIEDYMFNEWYPEELGLK
jgi:hypothetical protein